MYCNMIWKAFGRICWSKVFNFFGSTRFRTERLGSWISGVPELCVRDWSRSKTSSGYCVIHEPLIMNWFKANEKYSNSIVEGLNRTINLVTRKSYGFRILVPWSAQDRLISYDGPTPWTWIHPQILLKSLFSLRSLPKILSEVEGRLCGEFEYLASSRTPFDRVL